MLRLIITLPFLILLVVFVLFNETPQAMLLPGYSWQSSPGVVTLISAVLFFLLGALMVWFSELRQRRRARRAEQQVRALEIQITELRGQLAQSVAQNVAHDVAHNGAATYQGSVHPGGTTIVPAGLPPASY